MSTTTITPNPLLTDSKLAESYFGGQPGFPTIRQTPTASWPTVDPDFKPVVRRQTPTASWPTVDPDFKPVVRRPPQLNKIYFNKKTLKETVESYNLNSLRNEIAQVWEIPFSVDVEVPVTELTQRIQRVMIDRKIYRHWDIDFSNFIIVAKQVINK